MEKKISALIGALLFIVLTVAVSPTMFAGLNATGGPSFMNTVLPLIVAIGIIMAVYKAFN